MKKLLIACSLLLLAGCADNEQNDQSEEMEEFVHDTLTNFSSNIEKLQKEVDEKNKKDFPYNPITVGNQGEVQPTSHIFTSGEHYVVKLDSYTIMRGIHTFAEGLKEPKEGETFVFLQVTFKNVGNVALLNEYSRMLKLKTGEGAVYEQNSEISYHIVDALKLEQQKIDGLNPNSSSTVYIAFELSEEVLNKSSLFLTVPTNKVNGNKTEFYTVDIPIK